MFSRDRFEITDELPSAGIPASGEREFSEPLPIADLEASMAASDSAAGWRRLGSLLTFLVAGVGLSLSAFSLLSHRTTASETYSSSPRAAQRPIDTQVRGRGPRGRAGVRREPV